MKQQIKHRYTDEVLFECELPDDTKYPMRDALATAVAGSADLSFSNLRLANLRFADLSSANLRSADLSFSNLSFSNLNSADLRSSNLRSSNLGFGKLVGERPYLSVGGIGSRQDYLTLWITDAGNVFKTGCFTGSLNELEASIKETHGGNNHAKEYAAAIALCKAHIEIWTPKE